MAEIPVAVGRLFFGGAFSDPPKILPWKKGVWKTREVISVQTIFQDQTEGMFQGIL